ncbi:Acetolactate synthase catalytic subunit (plasmid) [Neorhizobium galegae bv. officinalis bv. officinalis str. HAMBI 1141]|uniref:Acetolactate synthase catalytic subunit n=1 Tax=Neorhizobium galegae bv. officinalis bv. officinalis str. HAMBI 1141 TaxID=1028801 RepID=A0A068THS9_NEOGA|nr:acetolactate synthase catalytic subunit [Neorhizobium galegae]CDN57674.1 Acetolactate synthase catalytic subunit [Neorhizobium galegae bv. officinalis bv. officinalis str. HAMBI 1141]
MTSEFETVAQRAALALRRHDVEVIFGQSLPSAVILAAEALGIRQISYRQENMGGAMADGYARMSGRVAVVAAQNGPAATLLVPPLAEALKASIPIVALVQEVERDQADRNAFQELDHIALFQSCSKFVRRVVTEDRIDDYIDMAFTAAASGRPGPAVLLLPADLLRQGAAAPLVRRSANLGYWPLDKFRPSDEQIIDLAERIARAEAPLVIAGGGVHAADGPHALAHLQDLASLPVFTTNMGKGAVDEFHPLSAGPMTLMGPLSLGARTRRLLEEADLIVMVATRSNQNGTDSWRLIPPTATIVHIDIDPVEIGRNYEAIRLVGSAAETLKSLCIALKKVDLSTRRKNRRGLEAAIAEAWSAFARDRLSLVEQNGRPLRPEAVMKELQERMTAQTIVVADASYSSMWIVGQLRSLRAGMRFLAPRGLAGLGWGLPLALGAKAARPGQRVIAVVGDGGFAHSWAELETLVRSRLPVTILLLNNGILGFQKHAETVKFGEYTSAIHFHDVDHVKIAEACGCPAVRSHSIADVSAALDRAFETDGPLLVEIMTDPDAFPALSLFAGLEVAA